MSRSELSDHRLSEKSKAVSLFVLLGFTVFAYEVYDRFQDRGSLNSKDDQLTAVVGEGEVDCLVKPYYVPEANLASEDVNSGATPIPTSGEIFGPPIPEGIVQASSMSIC